MSNRLFAAAALAFGLRDQAAQARTEEATVPELSRGERLQIMLTREELQALDDWRFARRMPSRAAAVRELLKRGLTADGFDAAGPGTKSQDFGLLDAKDADEAASK